MILAEIEIPVMEETYDFQLDEQAKIGDLTEEILELICLHRQCGSAGAKDSLTLWDADRRLQLPADRTAAECGITNGTRLMLV